MFSIAPVLALACLISMGGMKAAPQAVEAAPPGRVVTVYVDGQVRRVCTSAETVGELLRMQEIGLGPLDRVSPPPDAAVAEGSEVRVTRVARREVTEHKTVPSRTIVLADPDRLTGYPEILQRGEDGLVERVWRVWEKDGEETVRGLLEERVLREATDTVVIRSVREMPSRGGNWRRPMEMEATAYYPGRRSCGRWATGYTATGAKAEKGVVAVDERVIPMGTRLYIPGYGFAVAADRGGAIKGRRIDLCFDTYEEAVEFGRRRIWVYRLD